MLKRKKFIIIGVLVALVLALSLSGVALAQTPTTTTSDSSGKTLLARVAAILGIEQSKVEDAFAQAERDMQKEALDKYLNNLVTQGKITQEQANQYKQWWQSQPDTAQIRQQIQEWMQARPDIPPIRNIGPHGFGGGVKGVMGGNWRR